MLTLQNNSVIISKSTKEGIKQEGRIRHREI